MILFILFILAVCVTFWKLFFKAIDEYSYHADVDVSRSLEYWYYQQKLSEKQYQ